MKKPLWQPTELKKKNSILADFAKFINFKSEYNFKDLWKWTIENPEEFWTYFWDYSKIKGDKGKEVIQYNKVFNKTPKAFAYTDNIEIIGAPFYIMSKVAGEILTAKEAHKRQVTPDEFKTISNTWLDTFVTFHSIDYKAAGLEDLGRPEGYVERQVTNWGKQYLKAATKDVPSAEKVMQWMQENQPKNYQHCLIHNDYKYDNVVFKDNSWKEITAVLDWEMATLGDPLMDLGTSLGYWTLASDHDFVKQGIPSPTIFEGNPMRSEIVASYAKKSGRDINKFTKDSVIFIDKWFRYIEDKFDDKGEPIRRRSNRNLIHRTKYYYNNFGFSESKQANVFFPGSGGDDSVIIAYDCLLDSGESWEKLVIYYNTLNLKYIAIKKLI